MKSYSTFLKSLGQEPHQRIQFNFITWKPLFVSILSLKQIRQLVYFRPVFLKLSDVVYQQDIFQCATYQEQGNLWIAFNQFPSISICCIESPVKGIGLNNDEKFYAFSFFTLNIFYNMKLETPHIPAVTDRHPRISLCYIVQMMKMIPLTPTLCSFDVLSFFFFFFFVGPILFLWWGAHRDIFCWEE